MRSFIARIWSAIIDIDDVEHLLWRLTPVIGFVWGVLFSIIYKAPFSISPWKWSLICIIFFTGAGIIIMLLDQFARYCKSRADAEELNEQDRVEVDQDEKPPAP